MNDPVTNAAVTDAIRALQAFYREWARNREDGEPSQDALDVESKLWNTYMEKHLTCIRIAHS